MLFTFPSRYSFAIGLSVVFSLSGWSPIIQPEFLVFRHTQVAVNSASASRTGLSPSAAGRSGPFRSLPLRMTPLLLPRHMPCDTAGLGSSPFDRLYLGNRCYFLFLRVLRCFSSPSSPRAFRAVSGSLPTGCPIRTSGGLSVFATRPGFSQLVTSFFASESHRHPPCALLRSVFSSTKLFQGPFRNLAKAVLVFNLGLLV